MPNFVVRVGSLVIECATASDAADIVARLETSMGGRSPLSAPPSTPDRPQMVPERPSNASPPDRMLAMLVRLQEAPQGTGVPTLVMAKHLNMGAKGMGGIAYRLAQSLKRLGMRPESVFFKRSNATGSTLWFAGPEISNAIRKLQDTT